MPEPNPEYRRQLARLIGLNQLRCLNCNYDLRGQEGEERRCPECGRVNTVEEISRSHAGPVAISRRLEILAGACMLPTIVMALLLAFSLSGLAISFNLYLWLAGAAVVWFLIVVSFGRIASFATGWFLVCVLYSAHVLVVASAIVLPFVAIGISMWILATQSGAQLCWVVAPIGGYALGAYLVFNRFGGARSPYHRGRERLGRIQLILNRRGGL